MRGEQVVGADLGCDGFVLGWNERVGIVLLSALMSMPDTRVLLPVAAQLFSGVGKRL